jgi:hypothetical protein
MLSQVYYLVRSQQDGQYLTAQPHTDAEASRYLLLFQEHHEALSYLNAHAPDVRDRFAVESVLGTQVGSLLKRWGFTGVGMVQDPLLPKVEFLVRDR